MAARSLQQARRRPQLLAPVIVLPSMLLLAYTGGASAIMRLDGFPEGAAYVDFALPGSLTLAAVLAGLLAGLGLGLDLLTGFIDRLFTSAAPRVAVIAGRLSASLAASVLGTVWLCLLGTILGVRFAAGLPGLAVMLVLTGCLTATVALLMMGVALNTGGPMAVQSLFPALIAAVLFSGAFAPPELFLEAVQPIVRANPLTGITEGMRQLVLATTPWGEIGPAFARLGAIMLVAIVLVISGRRKRWRA